MSNFKFSVVVPIYNVEEYLEETIESVLNQSIGFKNNIQMILVNDGSPDNSKDICIKYRDLYPNNIIFVDQENGGVSSARNNGMKYATGEYVNFLDSDDKWDSKALETIYNFMKKNDVNVAVGRMKFFEASNRYHMLDYKFENGTRVINIFDEPSCIHLHITASVIKREIAVNYQFDENMKYGEDSKYLNSIILDEGKYGVVREANFFYRKRNNNSSAIQNKDNSEEWYSKTLDEYYKYLMEYSKKKYNEVIDYVQHIVMYDYQFRLKKPVPDGISIEVKKEYIQKTKELFKNISDELILNQRFLNADYTVYALSLKYDRDIKKELTYKDGIIKFKDADIRNLSNAKILKINQFKIKHDRLFICGRFDIFSEKEQLKFFIKIDDEFKEIEFDLSKKYKRDGMDDVISRNYVFNTWIDIKDVKTIEFYFQYENNDKVKTTADFGLFSKLDHKLNTHYNKEGYRLIYRNKTVYFEKKNVIKNFFANSLLCLKLLANKKIKELIIRLCYYFLKLFKFKEIWLVSDRTNVANDNGMHMFKYINSVNDKKIKSYFVVNKNSESYEEMKKYGRVVAFNSFRYKMLFLLSDAIISSQADMWVYNPFGTNYRFFKDLYNFDFVFLQHGITKDDISDWLNIYDKDISIFVTAAKDEYESIINGSYGYKENVVKLTGFPRYDNLKDDSKKLIAVLPTWRRNLSGKVNGALGTRDYNEEFINSDYFKFYNDLINDENLLSEMRSKGYKGIFVVHPSHVANSCDFKGNDVFEVVAGFADYQTIFKEASLLVSDFSSVPFDFAYLKKPVVYSQFDRETFFGNHLYDEGYFKYERDGFGPVTYDYKSTIKEITNYIKNDCKMENEYIKRVEKFYKNTDHDNCKRVYEEIKKR